MAYTLSELVTAAGSKFRTLFETGTSRHFPLHALSSDGTNVAVVVAASTAPVATDPALVVSLSPNSSLFTSPSSIIEGVVTSSSTSAQSVLAAQGSGIRTYVTDITIANRHTTAMTFTFAGGTAFKLTVPASGMAIMNRSTPWRGTANTAWTVTCDTAGPYDCSLAGYTSNL